MRRIHSTGLFVCCLGVLSGGYQGQAQSAQQEVILKPVDNQMLFDIEEITAKAGSRLKVVLNNIATNPAMRHNFVLLSVGPEDTATIQEIGLSAIQVGAAKDFVPDNEAILAYTKIADPGERTEVEFTVPPPGDYSYLCTYLGHWVTMKGVLHSVE